MTSLVENPDERPVMAEDTPFGGVSNRPLPAWGVGVVALLGLGLGLFFWLVTCSLKVAYQSGGILLYGYLLAKVVALVVWVFVALVVGDAYDRRKQQRTLREKARSGEPMEALKGSVDEWRAQGEQLAADGKWRSLYTLALKVPVAMQLEWVQRYGVQKLPAIAERLRDAKIMGAPVRQPSGTNPLWLLPFMLIFPLLALWASHAETSANETVAQVVPLLAQTVLQSPAEAKKTLAQPANAALIHDLDGFTVENHRDQTVFQWTMGSDTCDAFYAYLKAHPAVLSGWVMQENGWPADTSSMFCWNSRGRRTELHFTITATPAALTALKK